MTVGVLYLQLTKQMDVIMQPSLQIGWRILMIPILGLLLSSTPAVGQGVLADFISADSEINLLSNGGFEMMKPAYWEATGDGAVWSREMSRTPEWSLALTGAGEASWKQSEAVRNWTPGIPGGGNPELLVGLYVYTDGVNTSPASDDEKFQAVFNFFTDATQTVNVLGEAIILDFPQDAASSDGWVRLSSETLGALTFPGEQAAKSATIEIRKGANATGTVYVDDVFMDKVDPAADGWPGGYFNTNADAGDNWYYWWDGFDAGHADWPENQPHIMTVTDADAFQGDYSLRIESNGVNQSETVGISERVPIDGPMLVSFRVKHEGNIAEDSVGIGQNNLGLTVLWYENMEAGAAGYGEVGGIDITLNGDFNPDLIPLLATGETGKTEGADWRQYAFVFYPVNGAIGMEIRPRYFHTFSGVTYWDDFVVTSLAAATEAMDDLNLLSNGGFETMKPAYWEASGDGAVWSREMSRTPEWSLALTGAGEASWKQSEAVRNWTPGIPGGGNPELLVGVYVYTDGVNTSPASDDEKFQAVFNFYTDATQTVNVLGEAIVLDFPQDAASSDGWVRLSSEALGALTFPGEQAAKSATIEIRKGANATGTVYVDDVFMDKVDPEADGWPGGYFNTNADAGDTWYYWWDGFDAGRIDWPENQPHIMSVTDASASEGDYSLRIESNGVNQSETVGISERVPVEYGVPFLVSFKVSHDGNIAEDSIGIGQNNLGLTTLWYENMEAGAAGYGEVGGADITLNGDYNPQFIPLLANSATGKTAGADWTQYGFVFYPRDNAIATEIRPRYFHAFSGVTYWDEIKVIPLGGVTIPTAIEDDIVDGSVPNSFQLLSNYPNPFNPTTTIAFELADQAKVSLNVYNVMGQRVANVLDNQILSAGTQRIQFHATDLPSGTYLYVLNVNDTSVAHKMVLLK